MQEDTPTTSKLTSKTFLEDSESVPKETLLLRIAECLKALYSSDLRDLERKKASNQLSFYFKRPDSLELFIELIIKSNSEGIF